MPDVSPAFFPPQQQPLLTRLVQSISAPLISKLYQVQIQVSGEDVAKVRALEPARVVYICNHPTMEDGIAMFGLSARVGQLFYYIVARESFKGWLGRFLQWCGCYSIRRGLGDRASIAQTLSLLKQPGCQLVIFPEGGCSYQNDTVMPFRSGAIQMPLQVITQLAKKAQGETVPDLYLVPISLKYRYTQPMDQVIEQSLIGLETTLGLQPTSADFYDRLIAIATQILNQLEAEYNLPPQSQQTWNQRIDRLKKHVITQVENQLNLLANNSPIRERVYKIQALLDTETDIDTESDNKNTNSNRREAIYRTTLRLLNFDAIYDGYVAEKPTPERFLETLMRLEREAYQLEHIKPKATRQAIFKIGTPINLKDYISDFRRDKSVTVDQLTQQLQQTVQANLAT